MDKYEPLDDVQIKMLQKSSPDPCPDAAAEILWLRAEVRRLKLMVLQLTPPSLKWDENMTSMSLVDSIR